MPKVELSQQFHAESMSRQLSQLDESDQIDVLLEAKRQTKVLSQVARQGLDGLQTEAEVSIDEGLPVIAATTAQRQAMLKAELLRQAEVKNSIKGQLS